MKYPQSRPRRLRQQAWIRDLVSENQLSRADLIWPVFVTDQANMACEIPSLPGIRRIYVEDLSKLADQALTLGIPAIAIFPQTDPNLKDEAASEALNPENLVCRSVSILKETAPELGLICDVALDPYTSHGHDGLLIDNKIANDPTVEILCKQAVIQAQAGCDVIAPSDMMDGRISAIRNALDQAGFEDVLLLSYTAKYASAFYGPFRDAVGSASSLARGDKKTYQMNPGNTDEAIKEAQLDINEGADILMVKPGMPYLDIIHRLKSTFHVPTFAYQVSGEYAMIVGAANQGWLDRENCVLESLLSFKRAGADAILTYFAPEVAEILQSTS